MAQEHAGKKKRKKQAAAGRPGAERRDAAKLRDAQSGDRKRSGARAGSMRSNGGRLAGKKPRAAQSAGKKRPGRDASTAGDPCGASRQCGACQHVAQPYSQQLQAKFDYVRNLYVEAGLAPAVDADAQAQAAPSPEFRPVLGMADPRHYRNKVISPFARGKRLADGKRGARYEIKTGMYAAHSHRLVDTSGCLIENQQAKQVVAEVKHLMGRFGIEPYDEDSGEGFMRHVVVRVGHESGEVLVTLVTNDDAFPSSKAFCRELVRRCPFITTVVQNVNTRRTNVILGEVEHRLYGPGFILDTLCGLSFRVSSKSFYQVNATQTEVLYNAAIDLAALDGAQDAIDAYCGTGTIGLVAASRGARSVVGVDSVESAIKDARENARHNGIENARFVVGDASAFMRDLARRGGSRNAALPDGGRNAVEQGCVTDASTTQGPDADFDPDSLVVFMDPPRAGSTEVFLDALAALSPTRVVYISCNAETQVRDLAYLQKHGYRLQVVQPVDMFPHTDHIEVVALLSRMGR